MKLRSYTASEKSNLSYYIECLRILRIERDRIMALKEKIKWSPLDEHIDSVCKKNNLTQNEKDKYFYE